MQTYNEVDRAIERIKAHAQQTAKTMVANYNRRMRANIDEFALDPLRLNHHLGRTVGPLAATWSMEDFVAYHAERVRVGRQQRDTGHWAFPTSNLGHHVECLKLARYFRRFGFKEG